MSFVKIFKKVIIPCAAGVTSKANTESHTYGANCIKRTDSGTKPSDLPIYSKECVICREANQATLPPSSVEETVGNIRKELWVWQDSLKGYRQKIINVYRKSFSKADCPEKLKSRNHLENCFDDKINQPPTCPQKTKENGRSLWSIGNKFDKICLDRCGKPCSGGHWTQNQYQKESKSNCQQKLHKEEPCHLCELKPPLCESSFNKNYCPCCQSTESCGQK